MAIEHQIYDSATNLGVMRQFPAVPDYWLSLAFPGQMTFESEFIDFEKIHGTRKLAPFVAPTAQGQPIYSRGSNLTRLKPAYVKPRDAVEPHRMLKKQPGSLLEDNQSPAQRWDAVVADINRDHRESIERRWEWLAAKAVMDGAVTISGDNYPERYVDFGRDPNLTVTMTGQGAWNGTDADPMTDINAWLLTAYRAKFGGALTRMTCGVEAYQALIQDQRVQDELKLDIRGTQVNLNRGIVPGVEAQYMGTLGSGLEVWMYRDYYEDENGTLTEFMDPRDVVLTGNVDGVRAFGAILDRRAGLRAMPIFPKMWDEEDPSATYLMSQSAPLMVPVYQNRTMRARVIDSGL